MCRVLQASRSGYYDWQNERIKQRSQRRVCLLSHIRRVHEESRLNYGSPRITQQLRHEGICVNHKTVEKLMKENGIASKRKRKFKATTSSKHNLPIAANYLQRQFQAPKPNTAWVSDITYVPTEEGWLYLATFIDLCTRKIVGWSMSSRMTTEIVLEAFRMGVQRQNQMAPALVHSDRGAQYASEDFRRMLMRYGCMQSMSRKANCWDNAVAESFFGALKTELVHQMRFKTREQARLSIFDYIETFYNRRRLHSSLGYLSPLHFERTMTPAQATG